MGNNVEIERKFLVISEGWKEDIVATRKIKQGYIMNHDGKTVRVRTMNSNGFITIKGPRKGISRAEYEYKIPFDEAEELLKKFCTHSLINKTRYSVMVHEEVWYIDVFHGDNEGLIVAECEILYENQPITIPEWAGEEISNDQRYYNSALSAKPFRFWDEEYK